MQLGWFSLNMVSVETETTGVSSVKKTPLEFTSQMTV